MITFERFLAFGAAQDPRERVGLGASAFLDATGFAAVAITCSPGGRPAHRLEYSHGYPPEVQDYIQGTFVPADPFYRSVLTAARPRTWDGSDFPAGYAAERWLKPAGFRNGVSAPIFDDDLGDVGSIHVNTFNDVITGRQLTSLDHFTRFLAVELAGRKRRLMLGLSERELEVVRLIGAGATNPEIARHLHVSASTVRSHLENILRKFGTRSRVGVAVEAARLHLL